MQQNKELIHLDELIADLGGTVTGMHSIGSCGLLLKHLQAARRDLLGTMRGEYLFSLQQAKESVGCISDQRIRAETRKILQGLLEPESRVHR